ncbi:helix-turn-helix transcriptional regulator [Aeromonas eucrenophila]|uniref:Helix-turn-helix transcriptional regulator n=2 Tax=Aeromonas eucrenophila TaxID=649 RepID=A0ABW0YFV5_9GAMM
MKDQTEKSPSNEPTPLRFIRMREVTKKTGLCKSSIYELINKKDFPQPVHLSARSVAFIESEVEGWMADRISASRNSK